MKPLMFLVMFCFALFGIDAHAHSFFLKSREVGLPNYRALTEIWMKTTAGDDLEFINLEFIGGSGPIIAEEWTVSLPLEDATFQHVTTLPLHLELNTCKVNINARQKISTVIWGKCIPLTSRPPERHLPDLRLNEEGIELGSFEVTNEGANISGRNIKILSYLKDIEGKVIWHEEKTERISLPSGQSLILQNNAVLKQWQFELGCHAQIVIDLGNDIHELNKKNNSSLFNFGNCLPIPRSDSESFDFIPIVRVKDGLIFFDVVNVGRLPLVNFYDKLEYEIIYKNKENRVVLEKQLTVRQPLYGFKDQKTVLSEPFPLDSCRAEVRVNKKLFLIESNYQNNADDLDLCQNLERD